MVKLRTLFVPTGELLHGLTEFRIGLFDFIDLGFDEVPSVGACRGDLWVGGRTAERLSDRPERLFFRVRYPLVVRQFTGD